MSPAVDPMTFDELSELYRVEMKSASLTQTRRDLFKAMANLLTSLRQEYDRNMSIDPDSVMTEGAEQRRKKADRLCKDIVVLRTRKIASMAIRGAEGARNELSCLTDDERAYYDSVLDITKRQLTEIDRLRGKRPTVDTRIDEPPARDTIKQETVVPEPIGEQIQEPMDDIPDPEDMFIDEEPFDEPANDIPDEMPVATEVEATIEEQVAEELPPVNDVPEDDDEKLRPILIRVLEDLPEFAGPDRDYKLSKEDLVTMPKVLADVLVNTEKATVIRPTP